MTTPGHPSGSPALGLKQAWYVACSSRDLERRPLARTVLGQPMVLFRGGDATPTALLDRCAHRNVPLSIGTLIDGRIECRYHGWQYGTSGRCEKIPGLCDGFDRIARNVPHFATIEENGLIWVYGSPDETPSTRPFALAPLDSGATEVRRVVNVESPLHPALENALDVPHTAVLHHGLFRGARVPHRIKARVSRTAQGVQAEYIGEPRPEGLAAKLLAPAGGVVTHVDRFILPSIAQVEYRLGDEAHFLVNSLCTPVDEYLTRIHAVIAFRSRLPGWMVKLALTPLANRIFRQDAGILQAQSSSLRKFGGEHYASTAIDVLGLQIARLLRHPEAGAAAPDDHPEDWSREIELEV
ncbi:MAG TPA: aromatic ring-hydroxylating dioxygenase subunit alpha [Planctomycetota bacterium]|nr:aromatic ring-hydroxylating dioxygenase subunit alpha [Planctomycetota bacterium]